MIGMRRKNLIESTRFICRSWEKFGSSSHNRWAFLDLFHLFSSDCQRVTAPKIFIWMTRWWCSDLQACAVYDVIEKFVENCNQHVNVSTKAIEYCRVHLNEYRIMKTSNHLSSLLLRLVLIRAVIESEFFIALHSFAGSKAIFRHAGSPNLCSPNMTILNSHNRFSTKGQQQQHQQWQPVENNF